MTDEQPSPPAQETYTAATVPPAPPQEQAQGPERVEVLREAASLISGDREQDYGPPDRNFATIAGLWSQILRTEITSQQVALCMIQLKMARMVNGGGTKRDSLVDIAGYAGLAWELRDR